MSYSNSNIYMVHCHMTWVACPSESWHKPTNSWSNLAIQWTFIGWINQIKQTWIPYFHWKFNENLLCWKLWRRPSRSWWTYRISFFHLRRVKSVEFVFSSSPFLNKVCFAVAPWISHSRAMVNISTTPIIWKVSMSNYKT